MIYNIFFAILLIAAFVFAWLISAADWRRRIIPDAYLFPLMLIGLLIVHFFPWPVTSYDAIIAATFGYLLSAFVGFVFDLIRRRHKKDADSPIGMGDIKLMAVGGIWLGTTGLAISLIIACITGLIWGVYKKEKFIPFAPFFIFSGILALITMAFLI